MTPSGGEFMYVFLSEDSLLPSTRAKVLRKKLLKDDIRKITR